MKVPSSHRKLLITRFPLESAWGGEEGIHLRMAEVFRKHDIETELLSSCKYLTEAFNEQKFYTKKEFQKDITSKVQLLLSIIIVPFFFLRGMIWLGYFRLFRKTKTVLFLTFIEKITWTPIAQFLGMKVFWGHHAPLGSWFFCNPYLFFWKLYSRFATIIVTSESMKSSLTPYVQRKNSIQVIPNISLLNKKFDQKKESRDDFYTLLSQKTKRDFSKKNTFFVATTSRLSPEKGIEDLVFAAETLLQKNSGLVFLSAGTGSEEKSLHHLVHQKNLQNYFFFLGFLQPKELPLFLQHIGLLVCPSHQEPFGISILEAMSAKKAIVASEEGGIPELLGEKNIGLFETKNRESLVQKIKYFIQNSEQRKTWGRKNYKRWEKHFSSEKFEGLLLSTFFDQ